ncbi:MAG: N-acetyltransferase family protein [Bacteroidota bacterium]
MIRKAHLSDDLNIANIYNYYILNSMSTFEEQPVSQGEMRLRIEQVQVSLPWLVYETNNEIRGYAYATQWKPRSAYRNTVESTVYVRYDSYGKGIGRQLYEKLIEELKALKLHAVLAGITLPNEASMVLHEKLGFTKVGKLKEVGYKFEKWADVGYWELIFNELN